MKLGIYKLQKCWKILAFGGQAPLQKFLGTPLMLFIICNVKIASQNIFLGFFDPINANFSIQNLATHFSENW